MYGFAFLSPILYFFVKHILTCLLDLTSWSFLCTVSKVKEDEDEGVQSETEGSEKTPFLGKDQKIEEDENAGFEELTEEVKVAL